MKEPWLEGLTPAQAEAVAHVNGPMLVVAGAGSGKTRVVTRRVARLIGMGVPPWRILALTFTNKAAREMRERVEQLVGEAPAWMGTFHSICARMLRFDIDKLQDGRDNRYSILDQGDQESLVKQCLKALDADDKSNKPSAVLAAISRAKSDFISPAEYVPGSWRDEVVAQVYAEYEKGLRAANALDFDDLLIQATRLLEQVPEILGKYRARFPYILVDEYQDTNRVQYRLLRALAGREANLHATGDPDQSIYSWRGADYRNIMDFQQDYPGARIVRLEQNYRSSKSILAAANQLIRHNTNRIDKDLFTDNPAGDPVTVAALQSDRMEALWIIERLAALREAGERLGEMAVFYRTNAQSRTLEEALMSAGLPYQLVGGVRFYERREVKDLLAHLKLRINPRDAASLRRVVACRPGIGEKTVEKIAEAAGDQAPFSFLADPAAAEAFKANKKVRDFAAWCRGLAAIDVDRADVAVKDILNHSGLIEALIAASGKDELAEDRLENLYSLSARAGDFVRLRLENAPTPDGDASEEEVRAAESVDLAAFLEDVALVADVDGYDGAEDKVTLMTLHSAKGLEFDTVAVAGLEEGVLPHRNCFADAAVEEERRLFYVGLTRARKRALVTHAEARFTHGMFDFSRPSRFLAELPESPDTVVRLDYADAVSPEFGSGMPAAGRARAADPTDWDPADAPADFDDIFADAEFGDLDGDFDPNPDFAPDPDPELYQAPPARTALRSRAIRSGGLGVSGGVRRTAGGAGAGGKKTSKFKPGDLVKHPMFGSGKVLTVERKKIMVQFFSSGTRLLYEELSQLTRE